MFSHDFPNEWPFWGILASRIFSQTHVEPPKTSWNPSTFHTGTLFFLCFFFCSGGAMRYDHVGFQHCGWLDRIKAWNFSQQAVCNWQLWWYNSNISDMIIQWHIIYIYIYVNLVYCNDCITNQWHPPTKKEAHWLSIGFLHFGVTNTVNLPFQDYFRFSFIFPIILPCLRYPQVPRPRR